MATVDNFKPLADYVVVLIPVIKDKTPSGLLKTEAMKKEEFKNLDQLFKVVSVGDKVNSQSETATSTNIDNSRVLITKGCKVLCTRINEVPVDSLDEDFQVAVVRYFDIIGVVNEV